MSEMSRPWAREGTETHCNTLQRTATHCNTIRLEGVHSLAEIFEVQIALSLEIPVLDAAERESASRARSCVASVGIQIKSIIGSWSLK